MNGSLNQWFNDAGKDAVFTEIEESSGCFEHLERSTALIYDAIRKGLIPEWSCGLIVSDGFFAVSFIELKEKRNSAGRENSALVYEDERYMSIRHFDILLQSGVFCIRDNGSNSGTSVNGITVAQRVLVDGDYIQAGASRFVFVDKREREGL